MLKVKRGSERVEIDEQYKVSSSEAQTCSIAKTQEQVCVLLLLM